MADLLTDILSGRTGRLYKGLVQGRELANEVQASVSLKKYAGIIQVESVVKDDKDPAAVEAAIYEELERLAREPVPDAELQKVKNQAKANAFRRLSSPFFIALQLSRHGAALEVITLLRRGGPRHRSESSGGPRLLRKETARRRVLSRRRGGGGEDTELGLRGGAGHGAAAAAQSRPNRPAGSRGIPSQAAQGQVRRREAVSSVQKKAQTAGALEGAE